MSIGVSSGMSNRKDSLYGIFHNLRVIKFKWTSEVAGPSVIIFLFLFLGGMSRRGGLGKMKLEEG